MKLILLVIIFCIFTVNFTYSQTINGVSIKEIETEYIQIIGIQRFMSKKITIELDFGQRDKNFTSKEFTIRDKSGNKVKFNSIIDALNFMSENGFEFVDSYALTDGKENVFSYLMKKK